jgi:hypothetical protein
MLSPWYDFQPVAGAFVPEACEEDAAVDRQVLACRPERDRSQQPEQAVANTIAAPALTGFTPVEP